MAQELVKTVFGWEHFVVYLSGSIDCSPDGGRGWRDVWTEKLVEMGFARSQIFNPCKKPLQNAPFNLDNEAEIMKKHREKKEWKELCGTMSQIAHVDLRLTDKSDVVLVNFPQMGTDKYKKIADDLDDYLGGFDREYTGDVVNDAFDYLRNKCNFLLTQLASQTVPTYGTIHEIVVARQQRKPVFIVWEGGKEHCSAWLMWLVGHQNVFSSVDELMTRLKNISKGRAAFNAKDWLLLDLEKFDGV